MKPYDLIIIGAGPAGMSAAVYAARYKLNTAVFGALIGGSVGEAWEIHNFLTYDKIAGFELVKKMKKQVEDLGVEIKPELVNEIKKSKSGFEVKTSKNTYEAKKVILAIGSEKVKLNLKNEDKFLGKGVSYCATCDSTFFKNKTVVVVGGGNSALTSALLLAEYAQKVYIVYRRDNFFRAEPVVVDSINKNRKIETIFKANVVELKGKDKLEAVKLDNGREIKTDGLFIEIGAVPNTKLIDQLKIETENNFIKTDKNQKTSIKGVFAAGDITNNPLKQIITAAAEGAVAAYSAYKEISEEK